MVRAAAGKSSTLSPAGSLQEVFEQCRQLGMRLSRQRRMVLDLLWSEKSHLSARDIFEQLNLRGRSIGHTSVYQNLEALQSAGVIECLDRASGRLYGYRSDPHSHLTCRPCSDTNIATRITVGSDPHRLNIRSSIARLQHWLAHCHRLWLRCEHWLMLQRIRRSWLVLCRLLVEHRLSKVVATKWSTVIFGVLDPMSSNLMLLLLLCIGKIRLTILLHRPLVNHHLLIASH